LKEKEEVKPSRCKGILFANGQAKASEGMGKNPEGGSLHKMINQVLL
jgi:hypothetical protein